MFEGHVLPTLAKHTIVGLGVLCDHRCVVVLTAGKAYVMHENRLILSGTRKPGHLWFLNPQDSKKKPTVNSFIGMVPYMEPSFVICCATRCSSKKF